MPTAIKQSLAAQLEVLSIIDSICTKHDIMYFADWGSLLGAVRHGGIIPWDDDVDICMKRDDYNKFRAVADAELPENYVIHDYERKENHWLFLSRVVNNSHVSFDEDYLLTHHNFPWLSGVDIFVKDYLYRDPAKEKERCDEIMYILAVAEGIITNDYNPVALRNNLAHLSKKYSYTFPKIEPGRELAVALYKLAELQMARVPEKESDSICQLFPWGLKGNKGEPKEYYESALRLPFEYTAIPVPSSYNKVLSRRYRNYLTIRKGTAAHDYPSYEAQRKQFIESTGADLPKFTFDQNMLSRPPVDKSSGYKTLANECIEGFNLLYDNAVSALASGDTNAFSQALSDSQQLATDLGNTLEYARGAEDPHTQAVVSILERLCETIYKCYQDAHTLAPIKDDLDELTAAINIHILSRKEVLFLPIGAKEWNTLFPIYRDLCTDSSVDITVIPLPLMFKDFFGKIIMSDEEIEAEEQSQSYPKGVVTGRFSDYDPAFHCPDRIYIQFPYDGTNPCLTVPGTFYAKELLPYTEDLIYLPIGASTEFTDKDHIDQALLTYYVNAPGVILSDHVYVQSDNIREQYINSLSSFAGEGSRDFWAKKITARPDLFRLASTCSETNKKELLFCISSYEEFEHGDLFKSAIINRMSVLTAATDKVHISLCTYPAESQDSFVTSLAKEKGIDVIQIDLDSPDSFVSDYDAYYGSASPLVPVFTAQKKPVMIANLDIADS